MSSTNSATSSANSGSLSAGSKSSSLPTLNTSNSINLVKLTDSNYPVWRAQIVPFLKGQRVFGYVDGSIPRPSQLITVGDTTQPNPNYDIWDEQDNLILSLINTSLDNDVLLRVYENKTSHAIWTAIEKLFAAKSKARAVQLRAQLAVAQMDDKSVSEYFNYVKQLADELSLAGKPLPTKEIIAHILTGLGRDYDTTSDLITEKEDVTLSDVYSMLLHQEERLKRHAAKVSHGVPQITPSIGSSTTAAGLHNNAQPIANYANSNSSGSRNRDNSNNRGRGGRPQQYQQQSQPMQHSQQSQPYYHQPQPQYNTSGNPRPKQHRYPPGHVPQCQVCFKVGHMAHECWHWFNQNFQPNGSTNRSSRPPQALQAQVPNSVPTAWVPDTGASHHMTQDFRNLSLQSEPYDGPDKVNIGDGSGLFGQHSS